MYAHALAQSLLDRYGILTKGAVAAERISGGFAAVYPCCGPWRRRAGPAAGTSSRDSARPSSRFPARWTGCAPWRSRGPTARTR